MTTFPKNTTNFETVLQGLLELHALDKEGKNDSEEADVIRDAIEKPWRSLSTSESERARWFSEDLYSISEPTPPSNQGMDAEAQRILVKVGQAMDLKSWDYALELLRKIRNQLAPELLSYFRGQIWSGLGYHNAAAEFFRHAAEVGPTKSDFVGFYLGELKHFNVPLAFQKSQEILKNANDFTMPVILTAADICFFHARYMPLGERDKLITFILQVLNDFEARITTLSSEIKRLFSTPFAIMQGGCYAVTGKKREAFRAFSKGLETDPTNVVLLTSRGRIQLELGNESGVKDFESAVRENTGYIWPYYFLAAHYLKNKNYSHCLAVVELGLQRNSSAKIKSQLVEWQAISRLELQFKPDLVREAFEEALRLDPDNEHARHNFEVFKKRLATSVPQQDALWEQRLPTQLEESDITESVSNSQLAFS